jgi:hypothetical protein
MKTVVLKLPDDVSVEDWVEENGLVLIDGLYHVPEPEVDTEAEQRSADIEKLGEALLKVVEPFRNKHGDEILGTILMGQGVLCMTVAGINGTGLLTAFGEALDRAAATMVEAAMEDDGEDEDAPTEH